jgi:hypothetical protein
MALEFLWPYFRAIQYEKEFVHMTTFPIYHDIGFFLGIQLPIILVLAFSIWAFIKNLDNIQHQEWSLMILTVFYIISCFVYFKNESYFYHYAWIAFIPTILIMKSGLKVSIFFLIVILPISINLARGIYSNIKVSESGKYVLVDTPSQDNLYFTDNQKDSFFRLRDDLIALQNEKKYSAEQNAIFVSGWTFGVAHFLNYSHASRHIFVIAEEIRPYEQTQIVNQWLRHNFAFVQPRKYYGNIDINDKIERLEVFSNSFDLNDFNKKRILSNTLDSIITDEWIIFPVIPFKNQQSI